MSIRTRGFASMDRAKQREIASRGGKAAHAPGRGGHEWTTEEAREAGRKGGATQKGGRLKVRAANQTPSEEG